MPARCWRRCSARGSASSTSRPARPTSRTCSSISPARRTRMAEPRGYDVVILGSGAAGLSAALALDPTLEVAVLAKGDLSAGSTAWAQGGIAAVLEPGDTFESHVEDTILAGAGLNRRETVEFVVGAAPAAIERLAALRVALDPAGGGEGRHPAPQGGRNPPPHAP